MKIGIKKIFSVLLLAVILVVPSLAAGADGGFRPATDQSNLIRIPWLFPGATGPAGKTTFGDVVIVTLNLVLLIVGALSVAFIIWGGLHYILASGNEEAAEKAKKTITSAIIGLLIVVLSFTMITIITKFLITGTP